MNAILTDLGLKDAPEEFVSIVGDYCRSSRFVVKSLLLDYLNNHKDPAVVDIIKKLPNTQKGTP